MAPPRTEGRGRVLSRDGRDPVLRIGVRRTLADLYHVLLDRPWWQLLGLAFGGYLTTNALFAQLYLLEAGSITHARPGSFEDAFFFSVQTMATIGYGGMVPATRWANVLVTLQAFLGVVGFAVITGLTFAKFSRPRARILFSDQALITRRDGLPTLVFRLANARGNHIAEAEAHVVLARDEVTAEGERLRRLHDLRLTRSRNALFSLTWTVLHPIDATSPLHGATATSLAADDVEIIVSVVGLDATLSQTVHARQSYVADEIAWGGRFADMIGRGDDGQRTIDYRRFHTIEPEAVRE